ncbi:transcriptional activator domain-containing protein [Asanoa ishikariensis]|uniref:Transcriptional activator domain-containing protein n=1 Tax=Asanoa ishikariensis TaxID=137265 RepID=A0A1H3UR79_9ACTN|nr:transcriptional activator domain-containing protein [Asanoa ishikariensis]
MILATMARKIAVTATVMVIGLGAAAAIWSVDQRGLPSSAQLATWLREPLTTDTLLFVVASAVVMVVAVTVAAAIRIAAMALGSAGSQRRAKVRFRPPTLAQSVAAALVGTAAVAGIADTAAAAVSTAGDGAAGDAPRESAPRGEDAPPPGQSRSPAAADAAAPRRNDLDTQSAVGAVRVGYTPFAGAARAAHSNHLPPAHANALTPIAVNRDRVTVRRGDTLWDIAGSELGDPRRWPEVFDLNKGKRQANGYALHDPDEIHIGWILGLPARHRAAPPAPPRESTNLTPPTRRADVTPPTPATPDLTSPPAQSDDGVVVTPSATVPASPAPGGGQAASAVTPIPSADRTNKATPQPAVSDGTSPTSTLGWVQIAGGAMSVGLAAALVYAAATVWRRRRHHYRPAPITSPNVRDADLSGPLATLTWLRRGVRRAAPHLLDRKTERGPTVREYVTAQVKPALPPQGPTGGELAGVGALPVTAGLGLDGPAARDAARALLVATLTTGNADDPHAQGHVITPAATLASLLGVSAIALPPMQRLTIAATFPAALALLEEEIIRRTRIVAEHEANSVFAVREQWTFGEPLPQLLLIADAPDPSWHPRLSTAIHLGKNVDIGAVLIGTWPDGATLTVAADGTTHRGNGERVAVLDTAATTDILTMLAEAHGDTERPAEALSPEDAHLEPATATPRPTDNTASADPDAPESEPTIADAPTQPATTLADRGDSPAANRVRARALGEPAILGRDGRPVRGLRAKSVELFVYLVVHRAGANLDDIMEALWPDVTVSRAGDRLSTCVANLRTTIRSIAQPDTDQAGNTTKIEPVINTGGRYHLNPSLLQVDWWTVQDEYARVAAAADNDARLNHLRAAIAAASGGLADGSGYEWIDTDREHVRRRLLTIYAQAADLQVDNDPSNALALYDTAYSLDPLSEDLARRAMRTAARLGDAAGVRERLTALRRELDDNGMDIDPDTEELATTLLSEGAKP